MGPAALPLEYVYLSSASWLGIVGTVLWGVFTSHVSTTFPLDGPVPVHPGHPGHPARADRRIQNRGSALRFTPKRNGRLVVLGVKGCVVQP